MEVGNSPVRVGLIGCGNVAESRHLPALATLNELQIVALADIDQGRLRRVADRFRVEHRYPEYRALLTDSRVEAVAICSPMKSHVEMAIAALDAGKHVLVEKPLATSLDEAERLIAKAGESPCQVLVGYNLRWHRLVRRAREMILQAKLGPIELAASSFTSGTHYKSEVLEWKKRRPLGGGVLMEHATHYFDLWRFMLQTEVEEVFAETRSDQWDDVTGVVTARLTNGVLAAAYFSEWTSDRNEVHIYGQAGSLHLSLYRFDGLEFTPLFTGPGQIRNRWARIAESLRHLPRARAYFRKGGEFYASSVELWRHFARSIREGIPVECSPEDGLRALEVALATCESASSGRPVRVREAPRKITPLPKDLRTSE